MRLRRPGTPRRLALADQPVGADPQGNTSPSKAAEDTTAPASTDTETLANLKQQVDLLQKQLEALSQGDKKS